jgi:hypothetical protein
MSQIRMQGLMWSLSHMLSTSESHFTNEIANTQFKVCSQPPVLLDLKQKSWACEFNALFVTVFGRFPYQSKERRELSWPCLGQCSVMKEYFSSKAMV